MVIDAKNWNTNIPLKELEKLHGDSKARNAAGAILVIPKGAVLNDNANEYALKHNILVVQVDINNK